MIPEKAFILAGGKGERLKPLTDSTPKPLLEVSGKAILLWTIDHLKEHGVTDVVLGVGHMAEKIEKYFGNGKNFGLNIYYSHEKHALGTAGALKNAGKFFDKRFFMLNGDNLMDIDFGKLNEVHEKNKGLATITVFPVDSIEGFGVVELDKEKVMRFVEKPKSDETESNLINAGSYVLEPEVIEMIPQGYSMIEKDIFPQLAEKGKLFAYVHKGEWHATDTHEKLKSAGERWRK